MPDTVRIDIEKTRTKYTVKEEDRWVIGAIEYVNLYDGSTKMRAKSRELEYWEDDTFAYVSRKSLWKDNITTVQTYVFGKDETIVENLPRENTFRCLNCRGKIVHYEIRDITYNGDTTEIESPFSFGHRMKVEWDNDAYYSKVFQQKSSDKIIIKFRPKLDDETFHVRLFDPPDEAIIDMELGAKYNISVDSGFATTCIDIDHPSYGTRYICGDSPVNMTFNITYFVRDVFVGNESNLEFNLTGPANVTINVTAHQYDEVDGLQLDLYGSNYSGDIPKEVKIYVGGEYSTYVGNPPALGSEFEEETSSTITFSDGSTITNLTYSESGSQLVYFKVPKRATVTSTNLDVKGYDTEYVHQGSTDAWDASMQFGPGAESDYWFRQNFKPTDTIYAIDTYVPPSYWTPMLEGGVSLKKYPSPELIQHWSRTGEQTKFYLTTPYEPTENEIVSMYMEEDLYYGTSRTYYGLTYQLFSSPIYISYNGEFHGGMTSYYLTIYSRNYLTNSTMDIGQPDGIYDWSYDGEFNETDSVGVFINRINDFLVDCEEDVDSYCLIPITVFSQSAGIIELYNLDIQYDVVLNPIILNTELIQEYVNSQEEYTVIPITIESQTNGTISISNLQYNYSGGSSIVNVSYYEAYDIIDSFGIGGTDKAGTLTFSGSENQTKYFYINPETEYVAATLTVSSSSILNPSVDVGNDSVKEWSYAGTYTGTDEVEFVAALEAARNGGLCDCDGCSIQANTFDTTPLNRSYTPVGTSSTGGDYDVNYSDNSAAYLVKWEIKDYCSGLHNVTVPNDCRNGSLIQLRWHSHDYSDSTWADGRPHCYDYDIEGWTPVASYCAGFMYAHVGGDDNAANIYDDNLVSFAFWGGVGGLGEGWYAETYYTADLYSVLYEDVGLHSTSEGVGCKVPVVFEAGGAGDLNYESIEIYSVGSGGTIESFLLNHFYSDWDYEFPEHIEYLELIPRTPQTANVTPFGQTGMRPILNITSYGYSERDSDFAVYLDETHECVNLTMGITNETDTLEPLNNSWKNMTYDFSYLENFGLWMEADYNCSYSTWNLWYPDLYFKNCCVGCICSEELV